MCARAIINAREICMNYNHILLSVTLQRINTFIIDTGIVNNHYPFKKYESEKKNRNHYEKSQKNGGGVCCPTL
eukprot:UN23654